MGEKNIWNLIQSDQHATLHEAISFRGGSPFNALVVDVADATKTVVSYDLMPLLRSGRSDRGRSGRYAGACCPGRTTT